ncbi:MAG: hypothetical protein BAJALOKI1v1_140030 [Promethearchaeota archaeon]|nr:MAG: hypothetical protein BAJALOKI1v1_140030 [Candidatus Lokiarchaeota archaeon]
MDLEPLGIVFLFNMDEGKPEEVSKRFSEQFSGVTETLVRQGLLELVELKKILDEKKVYWGGIKKDFEKVLQNSDMIGDLAWQVFQNHTNIEASEDVKALIYDGEQAPWNFSLIVCVLYE